MRKHAVSKWLGRLVTSATTGGLVLSLGMVSANAETDVGSYPKASATDLKTDANYTFFTGTCKVPAGFTSLEMLLRFEDPSGKILGVNSISNEALNGLAKTKSSRWSDRFTPGTKVVSFVVCNAKKSNDSLIYSDNVLSSAYTVPTSRDDQTPAKTTDPGTTASTSDETDTPAATDTPVTADENAGDDAPVTTDSPAAPDAPAAPTITTGDAQKGVTKGHVTQACKAKGDATDGIFVTFNNGTDKSQAFRLFIDGEEPLVGDSNTSQAVPVAAMKTAKILVPSPADNPFKQGEILEIVIKEDTTKYVAPVYQFSYSCSGAPAWTSTAKDDTQVLGEQITRPEADAMASGGVQDFDIDDVPTTNPRPAATSTPKSSSAKSSSNASVESSNLPQLAFTGINTWLMFWLGVAFVALGAATFNLRSAVRAKSAYWYWA